MAICQSQFFVIANATCAFNGLDPFSLHISLHALGIGTIALDGAVHSHSSIVVSIVLFSADLPRMLCWLTALIISPRTSVCGPRDVMQGR